MNDDANPGLVFRPRRVTTLFVGESAPAQGTHFYRADSNLFRAVQAAFASAFGSAVPSGDAFLRYFSGKGCWLVDLADAPVNRSSSSGRRAAVIAGIPRLAELIAEARPRHIVVIKSDIGPAVTQAVELASLRKQPSMLVLRYPLRQWRAEFVSKLGQFMQEKDASGS